MSATWKMLGKGGTAKIKTFFCHCCNYKRDKIHHNNPTACDVCDDFVKNSPLWKDTWKCYHRQIMNSKYRESIEEEYNILKEELKGSMDKIKKGTKLILNEHDMTESAANPFSIGFQPSTIDEASTFQDLLVEECLLRDLDIVNVT